MCCALLQYRCCGLRVMHREGFKRKAYNNTQSMGWSPLKVILYYTTVVRDEPV